MDKYADDIYLFIPATNVDACAVECAHVEDWALHKNLRLNRTKSAEIVFMAPLSKRVNVIPPPAVPEIARVESIKVLGVTVSRRFSVAQHVESTLY